jgi:hypothetical protein
MTAVTATPTAWTVPSIPEFYKKRDYDFQIGGLKSMILSQDTVALVFNKEGDLAAFRQKVEKHIPTKYSVDEEDSVDSPLLPFEALYSDPSNRCYICNVEADFHEALLKKSTSRHEWNKTNEKITRIVEKILATLSKFYEKDEGASLLRWSFYEELDLIDLFGSASGSLFKATPENPVAKEQL